jgi:hypothetical protein
MCNRTLLLRSRWRNMYKEIISWPLNVFVGRIFLDKLLINYRDGVKKRNLSVLV